MKLYDNEETVLAKEKTYEIDYRAEDIFERGAEYLDELAERKFFLEAVKNYINKGKTDFSDNIENQTDIIDYIKMIYEKNGVKGDKKKGIFSYNPSSLKEWVDGKRLPSKQEMQRLALCLSMNIADATEFIFKGSLVKPFNFKDISDSVYYFCIKTNKSLADVLRITELIEKSNILPEESPENDTMVIGEIVESVNNEEDLIKYLASNKNGFVKQNQTALETLRALIKHSVALAEWERQVIFHDTSIPAITSDTDVPAILSVILGYEARAKIKGVEVYKKKISESNFPYLVKDNFPQPQQLQDILTEKRTSAEAIRKAIILFTFYNTFAGLKKNNKLGQINGFDLYADTVDEVLYKSGYIQMYWKHPYDWMFGYCAGAPDPLDELRALIEAFYLDMEEIYSEENHFSKD